MGSGLRKAICYLTVEYHERKENTWKMSCVSVMKTETGVTS